MFFSPDNAAGGESGGAPAAPSASPDAGASLPAAPVSPAAPATDGSIIAETPPPSAPAVATYVNADGTLAADWAAKLPEDFAPARDTLGQYKSVPELAKAYYHARQALSKKGVIPVTPNSSPAEVAEYRKAMGVPETTDAYAEAIKPKVQLPEGVRWNDELAKSYFDTAHKHNIPPAAMQELVALNLKQREIEAKVINQAKVAERQDKISVLRQNWGADFARNRDIAVKMAGLMGVSPEDDGFSSPNIVQGLVRLSKFFSEDKFVGPAGSLPQGAADYRSRARDIQTNKNNPLYERYHSGDREVQAMVRKYHEMASGGK